VTKQTNVNDLTDLPNVSSPGGNQILELLSNLDTAVFEFVKMTEDFIISQVAESSSPLSSFPRQDPFSSLSLLISNLGETLKSIEGPSSQEAFIKRVNQILKVYRLILGGEKIVWKKLGGKIQKDLYKNLLSETTPEESVKEDASAEVQLTSNKLVFNYLSDSFFIYGY